MLDETKFSGYRCDSGIVIFAWRVTWNYATSLGVPKIKIKILKYITPLSSKNEFELDTFNFDTRKGV